MIRSFLKNSYFAAATFVGIDRLRHRDLVREKKAAVLNLHRISPEMSPYWPPMHPKVFEALLRHLDMHFEVRSLNELGENQGNRPIAVLSFDDGYYDFIEHALPLLRKYRMRANMNVVPECAESGKPIWNVRLYDFLAAASSKTIENIRLRGFETNLAGNDQASKLRFGMAISKFLKNRPREEREHLFQPIESIMSDTGFSLTRMMSAEEIRQIAGDSEIGVHSYSHESMAHEDREFFENDFGRCSEYFSEKLHLPLDIYAFPNGSYRIEQILFLRNHGVRNVLLVDEKLADLGSDVIPRITMYGETSSEVRMRAVGSRFI